MSRASSIMKRKRFVVCKRLDVYQKFSFEVLVDWPVLRCRVLGSLCRTAKANNQLTGQHNRQLITVTMGDAVIEGSNWRLVEVGRVVVINGDHPFAGRLATIVEIIDHKRILVDGPSANASLAVPRQAVPLSKVLLSSLIVEGLNRGSRTGVVRKLWEKSEIDSKWEQTNWAKKRDQMERRKGLTDFERFQVLRLKKQRRFEERKALAKVKASA
ncbi:60S ribosomal protein L14-A [Fusarium oxysporum f. sp. conglutinans]|nr:60S ribosomal protein L14-A [Fusarium oxysporum f. sp. conglutinans]